METSYRFGPVEVRPAERQLLVEGQPAPVGARAFDVLLALIDRRDRVVTKNELLDIVWPGLIVEENNLQVQVSTLRKHLGARAVATIPGRGYRFTLVPEAEAGVPRSASALRHNLPAQLNRFIGRQREMAEVKALLGTSRLVTLASLGGTGKTRLSLQLACELVAEYPDGVWMVELAPITDEARIAQAVAGALGVQEEAGKSLIASLAAWSRERSLLLVLDNCEHVLASCAEVVKHLLQSGPGVHILASSREALRVTGETVYPLAPLATPDTRYATSSAILEQYDAVRLFVDRAMAANGSFRITDANASAVASICQRLDGIPLAIELAAARVRALSPENIAARLDDCFRLLTGGDKTAPQRQQTLRASLDWSHDLLAPEEATLLRRLAVFSGGWTLEAAESVCAGGGVARGEILDLLTHLVEKSLVEIDAFGERYRLLETVRQYAREKLDASGESRAVRDRHLAFYLDFASAARDHLPGPEDAAWLARLDQELENILAAHEWAGGEQGLRLVSAIKNYCVNRGLHGLLHRLAVEALAEAPERNSARCVALFRAGQMGYGLGRYDESRRYLEESISIARELGDRARIAFTLQFLGLACVALGDFDCASEHLEPALAMARESGNHREIAAALIAMGQLHRALGEIEVATARYEEAIAHARELDDRETLAIGLLDLAMAAERKPMSDRAAMVLEALAIAEQLGSRYVGQSALDVSAGLAALAGDHSRAAHLYGAAERLSATTGVRRDVVDEAFVAPLMAQARKALGPAYAVADATGRALSYDDAIGEARAGLQRLQPEPERQSL